VKTNMACARESDRKKVSDVLKKTLVGNPKHPSPAAETLGSDVSLVRDVVVPSIIAFTCLLLFRSRFLILHVVSAKSKS